MSKPLDTTTDLLERGPATVDGTANDFSDWKTILLTIVTRLDTITP